MMLCHRERGTEAVPPFAPTRLSVAVDVASPEGTGSAERSVTLAVLLAAQGSSGTSIGAIQTSATRNLAETHHHRIVRIPGDGLSVAHRAATTTTAREADREAWSRASSIIAASRASIA